MNVYKLIQLGKKYLQLWPQKSELISYFNEYQIIVFSRFVFRYFPSLAIITLLLPVIFHVNNAYPHMFFYALFIASIPIQALVMLGVKADKYLPPALASWYKESVARVNQQGGDIKLSLKKPRYFDLALLLNQSYQKV